MPRVLLLAWITLLPCAARADDVYRLWLRYDPIADVALRQSYATATRHIILVTPTGTDSPTLTAVREELVTGLRGLLGIEVAFSPEKSSSLPSALGDEGFSLSLRGGDTVVISAARDIGVLYGAFALLRHFQTHRPLSARPNTPLWVSRWVCMRRVGSSILSSVSLPSCGEKNEKKPRDQQKSRGVLETQVFVFRRWGVGGSSRGSCGSGVRLG